MTPRHRGDEQRGLLVRLVLRDSNVSWVGPRTSAHRGPVHSSCPSFLAGLSFRCPLPQMDSADKN